MWFCNLTLFSQQEIDVGQTHWLKFLTLHFFRAVGKVLHFLIHLFWKRMIFNLYFVIFFFKFVVEKKVCFCLPLKLSSECFSFLIILQSFPLTKLRTFAQIFSCENYYIFLYFLLNWASLSLFLFLLFLLKPTDSAAK